MGKTSRGRESKKLSSPFHAVVPAVCLPKVAIALEAKERANEKKKRASV